MYITYSLLFGEGKSLGMNNKIYYWMLALTEAASEIALGIILVTLFAL